MKHVIINFPGTDKRMAEGYTENDVKVGLWFFYNSSGDIIYRINYNEDGKLDGSVIAGHDNFYQNYEYDNNEMKSNIGYRNGRKNDREGRFPNCENLRDIESKSKQDNSILKQFFGAIS